MILGYFEPSKTYSLEDLERITAKEPEKGSWEMPHSIWLVDHGFEIKHFAEFDYIAFREEGIEYIRRAFGDETADWQLANSDVEAARSMVDEYLDKTIIIPRKPTIKDVEAAMQDGWLARVMVNSSVLNDREGYVGHSVVVTGYDNDSIWFHDPGLPAEQDRMVSRALFYDAMESFGGEMDIIRKT